MPVDFRLVDWISSPKGIGVAAMLCLLHIYGKQLSLKWQEGFLLSRKVVRLVTVSPIPVSNASVGFELVNLVDCYAIYGRNAENALCLVVLTVDRKAFVLNFCKMRLKLYLIFEILRLRFL